MKNLKMALFAMFLIVVAGVVTGCKPGKSTPEQKMNWVVEKVTDKLELDKDQENKLRDLVATVHETRKAQSEKRKAQTEEFKALLLSEKLDKTASRKLFDQRQTAMSESFDPVFEKLQVFHASLTAEQKKEAVKYLEKFEKRFR